ncbi:MAG: YdcF family protein [Pseudomonadota bacterium]
MNAADIVFLGLRPSNFILILLIAGLLIGIIGFRRVGLLLMGAGVVAFVACGVLPVGQLLLRPLEARFPFQGTTQEPAGIILLGGAVEARKTHEHNQVTLNDRADRVIAAASLARRFPDTKIIISDGPFPPFPRSGAELMAALLRELGIDKSRMVIEARAASTWDNARYSYDLVLPKPDESYILVTSAWHMPRAMGAFRAAGWPEPIAWPVDNLTDERPLWRAIEASAGKGLLMVNTAVREYLALALYYLDGQSDSLFPGPRNTTETASKAPPATHALIVDRSARAPVGSDPLRSLHQQGTPSE